MEDYIFSAGVEQTEEMKAWLWDNHFAALVSDQPAFEVRITHLFLHLRRDSDLPQFSW